MLSLSLMCILPKASKIFVLRLMVALSQENVVSPSFMITLPAMVSSIVVESIVFIRKLLPCIILMIRIVSEEFEALITCCAETLQLHKTKIKSKALLMVNFNRNGSVLIQPVNWGFIL